MDWITSVIHIGLVLLLVEQLFLDRWEQLGTIQILGLEKPEYNGSYGEITLRAKYIAGGLALQVIGMMSHANLSWDSRSPSLIFLYFRSHNYRGRERECNY